MPVFISIIITICLKSEVQITSEATVYETRF
jgi:hypothetical protein